MQINKTKKILSMSLLLSLIVSNPVFATSLLQESNAEMSALTKEESFDKSLLASRAIGDTVDGEKTAIIPVTGKSLPILIKADVPLVIPFSIDPNEKDETKRFVSPEVSIKNLTAAPVKVEVVSLTKSTTDAPDIVNETKYTNEEWKALGTKSTASNIAFGLKPALGSVVSFPSFYFAPEMSQAPVILTDALGVNKSVNFELMSKYGLSWQESKEFSYNLHVRLSLTQ